VALEWAVGLQSLFGSAFLAIVWLIAERGRIPDGSPEFWGTFAYIAIIASFGAQLAYFSLLRRRETTVVGSFVFLVPVVAAITSALLLGEPLTGLKIAGGACVLAGIALVNRRASNAISAAGNGRSTAPAAE
jgi:O-acetylserine/cysteine efflux transporter